jgi:Na+/pantothenate symporter
MSKMDSSKRCKDLDAYSKFMLPQLILLIAIMLLNMIVFVIHFYIVSINPVFIAMIIVFMGELAWYSYKINKSMKFFDK